MKSETMNTTLIRLSVFARCRTTGSIVVVSAVEAIDQHSSRTDHAAARVRRGTVDARTRSPNARKPVLIESDRHENRREPVMNVITSFFEYFVDPRAIERD